MRRFLRSVRDALDDCRVFLSSVLIAPWLTEAERRDYLEWMVERKREEPPDG